MKDEREQHALALCDAVRAGDRAVVEQVLSAHPEAVNVFVAQPRDWGDEFWLAIHYAAEAGEVWVGRRLLEAGASPDSRTRFRTPMHARESAVLIAAKHGHAEMVRMLLDRHGQFEGRDADHISALSHAAAIGSDEIVDILLGRGAMVDPVDDQQRTPLHHAIRAGHAEVAMRLIEAGADVNHRCPKDPGGFTPLHRCVTVGEAMLGVAEALVAKGVDLNATDPRFGKTAADLAREHAQDSYAWLV